MSYKEEVTDIWQALERGKNYNRLQSLYEDSEENYNYYHGRQWYKLKRPKKSSEPIVLNIVKPIVKYKVSNINQNSYEIVFNPNTYNTNEELEAQKVVSKGLTQFVARMWEKSQTGKQVRSVVKNACINSEGIMYFYLDGENIVSEEINKNNIYYGNENESNIQEQPYILITKRLPVKAVRELARKYKESNMNNLSEDEIMNITSDMDWNEENGKEYMLMEVSPMCTIVYKFERIDGTVKTSISTRTCDIMAEDDTECELYPFAHFVWEEEMGYSRGCSEVHELIENQNEINKTATRISIGVKIGAYPKIAYDSKYVANPNALTEVGSAIKLYDMRADDVNKVVSYLKPAQMSADASNFLDYIKTSTRELSGAGDTATGNIDPTQASGKAILAVQQATQQPLNEQVESYKYFLEDCAKIVFEMIKVYFVDGLTLYTEEQTVNDVGQTETNEKPFKITQDELNRLDLSMKIDITPRSPYDRYALELSLENLLLKNLITLEEYAEALPDDSASAKTDLENIIRKRKEARKIISAMQQQAEALYGAIQQEMIGQEGVMSNEMSQMPNGGNDGGITQGQQVSEQM